MYVKETKRARERKREREEERKRRRERGRERGREEMKKRGFKYDEESSMRLRSVATASWFRNTIMIFEK